MIVQYDGSHYHGFQIQQTVPTVQAALQEAIDNLSGEKVSLLFAGRTDARVHALGQVIAFDTGATIPEACWSRALNSHLPADIRVLDSQIVPADFHPRFQALKKHYRYLVYRNPAGAVCRRKYAWLYTAPLRTAAMQEACRHLIGTHCFRSFCASGSSVKTYKRTISQCHLDERGDYLLLDIAADGFLYRMVRIIMGTLMEIGQGRRLAEDVPAIIAREDRNYAGPTAPPEGVCLVKVDY